MSKSALITGIIFIIISIILPFIVLWLLIYAIPLFIIGWLLIIFNKREDKIEGVKRVKKKK